MSSAAFVASSEVCRGGSENRLFSKLVAAKLAMNRRASE